MILGVPGAPIFEDFEVPGSLWRPIGRQSGFWEHLGTHFGVILGASWEPPGQFWDTVFDVFLDNLFKSVLCWNFLDFLSISGCILGAFWATFSNKPI